MMTVKDAIGPHAFSVWLCVGYVVFAIAAWFVLFALCRAARDASLHLVSRRVRSVPQCRVVTLVRNTDRANKTVLVFPGAVRAKSEHGVTL
jgi:hypothetical protein